MKTALANWKTSLAGVITLALAAVAACKNPAVITEPAFIAMVTAGAGLVATQDAQPK